MGAIQKALGAEVWNLNMMDFTSYDGEWCTAVEVTIPALPASMLHLLGSEDTEAISAAQTKNQAQAAESLGNILQNLKPNVEILPGDHRAHICAEFCAANKDRLCREFSHFGSCPRGGTCRWAHAMVETFMINFIVAPMAEWAASAEFAATTSDGAKSGERWQPSRPPMSPVADTAPSCTGDRWQPTRAPATPAENTSPKSDDIPKMPAIKSLPPDTRPKNPRFAGRKKWSDIQEESDDELACF